jgi:hypothetical protein
MGWMRSKPALSGLIYRVGNRFSKVYRFGVQEVALRTFLAVVVERAVCR